MSTRTKLEASPKDFSSELLGTLDLASRCRIVALRVLQTVPGAGVIVYVRDQENAGWLPKAVAGEIALHEKGPVQTGTLDAMAEQGATVAFSLAELPREAYAHLNVRRDVVSLLCVPLLLDATIIGAIECLTYEQPITDDQFSDLAAVGEIATLALGTALALDRERDTTMQSITRLTQLYDVEKVFSSTIEFDLVPPIITSKVQEALQADAVNLWLVEDGDALLLVNQAGLDPTCSPNAVQRAGGGVAADVSETAQPLLLTSEDARIQKRNAGLTQPVITSILAAPLVSQDSLVGVLEVVNHADRRVFGDDDLFFLTNLSEGAANALHNASLLQSERKIEILQTLVEVSREITSTLNLDRILQIIVNGPGAVIPYHRAAIGMDQRGRVQVKAISGESRVNQSDPNVYALTDMLQWASVSDREIWIRQNESGDIDAPSADLRKRFEHYFATTGMRGFYAVPLRDDEGGIGVLSFESADPDFLTMTHREMAKVLASQATVALRNAQMYREVPFINVLEPLVARKRRFLAMDRRKRSMFAAGAALAVAMLVLLPFPMRVQGNAVVEPVRRAEIQPEIPGVVKQVFVQESQFVLAGSVIADMEDWDYRSQLAAAQAKFQTAISEMNQALAANDSSKAGVARVQAAYWSAEVDRARERLEHTHLRTPISGYVTTPHVQDFVGKRLAPGDKFADVEDTSQVTVDVAVGERDMPLLKQGSRAWLKLDSFPSRTVRGQVTVVSPKGTVQGDDGVFYARVTAPNPQGFMRAGMEGSSKISVGWHPLGYVLLRNPAAWAYTHIWSWLGW